MVTPTEANETRWREGKEKKNKHWHPFYCCKITREKGTAGGMSYIMQAVTAVQLIQIFSRVSTSVTHNTKCIMNGWGTGNRLSHWTTSCIKEFLYRIKMGNQRRTSTHATRSKPAAWDSARSSMVLFPAGSQYWWELGDALGPAEGWR